MTASLERILASGAFASSPRLRAFLAYLGRIAIDAEEPPKEYAVGVDVFDRPDDFNPQTDSIVRVHAGRLRKALETYFDADGRDDPIVVSLPKGGYRLEFQYRADLAAATPKPHPATLGRVADLPETTARRLSGWPLALVAAVVLVGVLFYAFRPQHQGAEPVQSRLAYLDDGITVAVAPFTLADGANGFAALDDQLAAELARSKVVRVASWRRMNTDASAQSLSDVAEALNVRYVVYGDVTSPDDDAQAAIQLIDALTGEQVWADSYQLSAPINGDPNLALYRITSQLRNQLFATVQGLIGDDPPPEAKAWHYFLASAWTPGAAVNSLTWERDRIALARKALAIDPDFGPAHAVLVQKIAFLTTVDPPTDAVDARRNAMDHARKALESATDDSDAMFTAGIGYYHLGRMDDAQRLMARTQELDPSHTIAGLLAWGLDYACVAGDDAALQYLKDMEDGLSPTDPARWMVLYWMSHMQMYRGELADALVTEEKARTLFANPLSILRYAALLQAAGETREAVDVIAATRRNWPNLDPTHYANIVLPRICPESPDHAAVMQLYSDMAQAVAREE